jgi:hypothetical protein
VSLINYEILISLKTCEVCHRFTGCAAFEGFIGAVKSEEEEKNEK